VTQIYFQRGFGLAAEVGPDLVRSYRSPVVERLKRFGYEASAGDVRVDLLLRPIGHRRPRRPGRTAESHGAEKPILGHGDVAEDLGEAPVADPDWDVGVTNVLALPYYEGSGMYETPIFEQDVGVVFDRIPKGEVEVRRTSSVLTSDGRCIGDVDGFIVDDDEQITHFVLEHGRLWRRREITIPIGAAEKVETDTVTVSLSEKDIGELPAHRVHRWFVFGARARVRASG